MSGAPLAAREIALRVRAGDLRALDALEASLRRIEAVDPVLSCFLGLAPNEARRTAENIDGRRRAGETLGPLAGVPVAIKDNLNWAGQPLTCGSRILTGYVAPTSATAVERLIAADAVLVGRTNLDEFAMGSSCENSAFFPTRNPWDATRVPGGSSGGSAVAVAAGCVPVALGSDTGGSVRQPAALCGIVGLKPTYGRVSRSGLVAFASSLDQIGPLSRSVEDAALVLSVIAGHDAADSTSDGRPGEDFVAASAAWPPDSAAGRRPRIGVVREIDALDLAVDVRRAWDRSLAALRALDCEIVEVSWPTLETAIAVYYIVANSEASANLSRFDGVRYGRRAAARDLSELYTASRGEGFGAEVKRRILLGTFALSAGYAEAYYERAIVARRRLRIEYEAALARVDWIATPVTPGGAFALGEKIEDPVAMYQSDVFTVPASLVGAPAVALPVGLDDRGLPLGLQLMGRAFDEGRLLGLARAVEDVVGFDGSRPLRPAEELAA
jgi:aspartyl-tRNA(Asn)/glutamyl-tRNA(Gln) amidotransferase subunit A